MLTRDCQSCQSAGSVNTWGVCEICGESIVITAAATRDWQERVAKDIVPFKKLARQQENGATLSGALKDSDMEKLVINT